MSKAEVSRKQELRRIHEAGRLGDVEALLHVLKRESDSFVRGAAVRQLGLLQEATAVEPLLRLLGAEDLSLQTGAIRALARIGDVGVSDDLLSLATDDRRPSAIQLTAALAMVNLGDRRAIPLIGRFVVDDRFSRREMKWALKKLRAHRGIEAIPTLQAGGPRQLGAVDRLRVRLLVRSLEAKNRDD